MSALTHASRGGDFATSRRGAIAEDMAFILQQHRKGVPVSAIARMIGRPALDVGKVIGITKPKRAAPKAIPARERNAEQRAKSARTPPADALGIISGIAAEYGLSAEDLRFSCKRSGGRAEARHDCYHALYSTGSYSYPVIADWFGLRGHHAVLEGVRKHAARMAITLRDAA